MQIFLSRNRRLVLYCTQELQYWEDECFLYLNLTFIYLYRELFFCLACTPPCCACCVGTEEPPAHIFKKAASSRIAGNAVDYFYCNSEKTENKKCVYVYISTRLYTHTPKRNILWSFKPRAKPGKLAFMLESLLAPKAKDSALECRAAAGHPCSFYTCCSPRWKGGWPKACFTCLLFFLRTVSEPLFPASMAITSSFVQIHLAFCNKNVTIPLLEPLCWPPSSAHTARH